MNFRFLIFFAFAALMLVACKNDEASVVERVVSVDVMVAEDVSCGEQRTYVGTVEESEAITLSFEAGGNVKYIYVKVGDHVSAGQLLARLDKESAQTAYDAAKSTLNQAEDGYNRAKQLYDNGSLPEIKWVEVQTKLAQAQSMEKLSRQSLDHCDLYAPTSGVIGSRNIEIGSNVSPFQPVMKIMNINQLKVRAAIPENEISKINIGGDAKVQVPAVGEQIISAKVIEKGIEANPLSHSYDIKCIFSDKCDNLLPGMVCKLFLVHSEEGGIVVPSNIVQTSPNGLVIWKIENGRAKRCIVNTNKYVSGGVLVGDGIQKGDTIVVAGYQKLYDNAKVEINSVGR
ncbi:MAG: efflux RND transporter periplasmic adaptor subunit [Bacteroidales bacterium]|nr:efflux RND transporter periplasmic adaptor subunit [Bacteroidales bacterium]